MEERQGDLPPRPPHERSVVLSGLVYGPGKLVELGVGLARMIGVPEDELVQFGPDGVPVHAHGAVKYNGATIPLKDYHNTGGRVFTRWTTVLAAELQSLTYAPYAGATVEVLRVLGIASWRLQATFWHIGHHAYTGVDTGLDRQWLGVSMKLVIDAIYPSTLEVQDPREFFAE